MASPHHSEADDGTKLVSSNSNLKPSLCEIWILGERAAEDPHSVNVHISDGNKEVENHPSCHFCLVYI